TLRLLVTGGAGFIGSNFVRYVLSRYADYEVLNLDKLTYAGNLENLEGLENHPRHTFFHGDICDPDLVGGVLKRGVDAVVNFARCPHNHTPYQCTQRLMHLPITNAPSGLPLPHDGDARYVRDWIHVQDPCSAVDRILHHGKSGELYNIGARQEMAGLEIARLI